MTAEVLFATPLPQFLGLLGAAIYMINYSLLSLRIVSSDTAIYFAINLVAALLVMISLSQAFNAAAAAIQSFWIIVSILSIVERIRNHRVRNSPTFDVWKTAAPLISDSIRAGRQRRRRRENVRRPSLSPP